MTTVTTSLDEYDEMRDCIKRLKEEISKIDRSLSTVYGITKEQLTEKANRLDDIKIRSQLSMAYHKGDL